MRLEKRADMALRSDEHLIKQNRYCLVKRLKLLQGASRYPNSQLIWLSINSAN